MSREFVDIPEQYYKKCANAGKMERIKYISNTYDGYDQCIEKDALVYLPYDYDNSKKDYNVLYLMHGGGGNSDEVFGGMEAKTDLKNILDHMIDTAAIQPLIVVAPSFYYKGTEKAHTSTIDARILTQNFDHELINDLIPAIEKRYKVRKGREYRAFGGYSMGAEATWNVFAKCLNDFKYFLPMSGDCWGVELQGGLNCPQKTVDYLKKFICESKVDSDDYRVFACVGDAGIAYKPMDTMIGEMKKHPEYFRFGKDFAEGNMVYCVANGGTHSYEYCYKYIYNALPLFFKEEILTVYVKITKSNLIKGCTGSVNMLQFEGEAKGDYFQGRILSGGVDWQKISNDEKVELSARYILEGVDNTGDTCLIAIENNGTIDENGMVRTVPCIVTDSNSLRWMETAKLTGTLTSDEDKVIIHILRED